MLIIQSISKFFKKRGEEEIFNMTQVISLLKIKKGKISRDKSCKSPFFLGKENFIIKRGEEDKK